MRILFGSPSLAFMYISASAPDAPPLSETTIGWLISLFFWIAACIIRAIWSEAPPAPAATTISTGFVGSQAAACMAGNRAAIEAATAAMRARRKSRRDDMRDLLGGAFLPRGSRGGGDPSR